MLVKSRWSPTGILVRDQQPAAPLPRQFDPEGYLHAGPGGRLWVQPEEGTDPRASTTLRLAELDGRPVPGRTVTVPASAAPYGVVPDGYGGILFTNRGSIYRLVPGRPGHTQIRLISRGDLLAAGGRRLLVWSCDRDARCQVVLVDQQTGHRTVLPAVARTLLTENGLGIDSLVTGDTLLSPDGTQLAVTSDDGSGTSRVHDINLRNGEDHVLPGAATDTNGNRQLAWSPNGRWLLALTDNRIRCYSTHTHAVTSVDLGNEKLLHLTAAGTAG